MNPYYEAPVILRDGSETDRVDWMFSQLRAASIAAAERDQRVRAEAQLAEAKRHEEELQMLYQESLSLAENLRRANEAKDEFLALVSHELRTPITVILGNAAVLKTRVDSLGTEDRDQVITDVHDEATRLDAIVTDLLTLARFERGLEVETDPILLHRLVSEVVRDFERKKGRRVALQQDESAIILGNKSCLANVLEHLLSNAAKYSPPESLIELTTERVETGAWMVSVLDQGIGLREDEIPRLFEPFYRSPEVSGDVRGLGVGLAVCRRIVEALNGQIWAERRSGSGSAFHVTFPAAD